MIKEKYIEFKQHLANKEIQEAEKAFVEGYDLAVQMLNEKIDKKEVSNILAKAEKDVQNSDISDQAKYLIDHKIEVLKSLTLN